MRKISQSIFVLVILLIINSSITLAETIFPENSVTSSSIQEDTATTSSQIEAIEKEDTDELLKQKELLLTAMDIDSSDKITPNHIANLLYSFAFNKKEGAFLWQVLGVDFNAPMSNDPQYLTDLAWFEQASKETLVLANGNQAFFLKHPTSDKTVIIAHGYRGNANLVGPWAKLYYDLGYNILAPDANAHGKSPGQLIDFGWLEKNNYREWINSVITKTSADSDIILHGLSMGAATVLMAAGEELPSNVKGIIADSAFTSLTDQLTYISQIITNNPSEIGEWLGLTEENLNLALPLIDKRLQAELGFSMGTASAVNQVKKATVPIGLIHSRDDSFIPYSSQEIIFNATASEKKHLWDGTSGNHIGSIHYNRSNYLTTLKNYLGLFSGEQPGFQEIITDMIYFHDSNGLELHEPLLKRGRAFEAYQIELPVIPGYDLSEASQTEFIFGESDQEHTLIFTKTDLPLDSDSTPPIISSSDSTVETSSSSNVRSTNSSQSPSKDLPKTGETTSVIPLLIGLLLVSLGCSLKRKVF